MSFEEWKEVRLGEIVESISRKHSFDKERIIFLNTSDVYDGRVLNHEYVSINGLPGQAKKSIKKGDILFSEIRPINRRFAYIDFDAEDYVVSTKLMVLRSKEGVIPKFLYYFLSSNETLNILQMLAESRSGTFPQITFNELKSILIFLPPEDEQSRIINFMECIDKKIELNNQINKNLEEMAQAIFKSWFVDFEPFRDGEFVESELGLIPKGWEVSSLDSVANYLNGLAMQKYRPTGDEFLPVIKIKELRQGFATSESDKATPDLDPRYIVENGDILFSWSGTLEVKIWSGGKGALNQHLFKVTSEKYDKWFYYYWTKHYLNKFRKIAEDKATTMGHIKRKDLNEAKVLIPDKATYKQINCLMEPIFNKLTLLDIQNKTLQNLRDTLLPKLMSGEIRVPLENEGRHQDEQLQRV
jgi:type I restriction enzyme, S subunit